MTDVKSVMRTLRDVGAYYIADDYGLIDVHGRDATRFLQAQTTNDVAILGEHSRQTSSLVDRKGRLQAYFDLYKRTQSYRILAKRSETESILQHLDHFRIADKVDFVDLSGTGKFFCIQGPKTRRVLNCGLSGEFDPTIYSQDQVDVKLWNFDVQLFKKSTTGEDGYFIWVPEKVFEKFKASVTSVCKSLGLTHLEEDAKSIARLEAGIPEFNIDVLKDDFLPETALEQTIVSYTKGCFLGQEVLARVKHLGAPVRGLMGIAFSNEAETLETPVTNGASNFALDTVVKEGDEEIAQLKTNGYSPELNRYIAFGSVKRDYRVPGKSFSVTIHGAPHKIEVTSLPFIRPVSLKDLAVPLYEQALQLYARENDAESQSEAVELLREALALNPQFEDAYEALGVILSKRGKLDEAINLMKQLAALNKDSVMAHTNLSVFYLEKGMKDEAEEEKAISVSIRMLLAARSDNKPKPKEDDSAMHEETRQRMGMFQQVLEIDGDDLLANYGMGSCHVALAEFAKAIPFLKKAISIKPSYTVAYVSLAQAYEGVGETNQAIGTYETGIEVAAKRGDMMPMSDMQQKLSALKERLASKTSA